MSLKRFLTDMIIDTERTFREDAVTDKIKNVIIDTCFAPDTQKWETGIKTEKDGWVIVEMYKNEEEAGKGHEKWCGEVRKNPNKKFKNCITANDWASGNY